MDILRKAKIVAKIADNKSEVEFLKTIFESGADVAWLNTAHQDESSTLEVINRIRQVSSAIPIMIDTKGPEVRTKNVEEPIPVKAGDIVSFTGDLSFVGHNVIHVTYPKFHLEVPIGTSILYDDASIEMVVEEKTKKTLVCVVKNSGTLKNKKSLNIPNVHISLPALTEKDKSFIHFCAKHNIDYIAHSFVRNKKDLFEIRDILKAYPDYKGKIISKIENREGFDNLAEILKHSEGIMVARGDLGAEVPLEEMTYMQKKMAEGALVAGKYCIVATQVLDSMIKNPRPTRAEVTDTANAILDGSGAVSMSGETAYGDYPREAIETMARIMKYTETKRDELIHFAAMPKSAGRLAKEVKSMLNMAAKTKTRGIVVISSDIGLSRMLSAHRPNASVVAIGLSETDIRELMLAYAVRPYPVQARPPPRHSRSKNPLSSSRKSQKGRYMIKKGTVKDIA